VIVSSSRYWFNYRHTVNALTMYRILKTRGGYTDDRIVLMLADEYAINARNPYKNYITSESATPVPSKSMATSSSPTPSLFDGNDIEIDYRGEDVTVENLARVLSGKTMPGSSLPVIPTHTPRTNIFLYVTGHGGDSFFKFQDVEEIMASDFAALWNQRSFHHALFIADTCQAFTLGDQLPTNDNDGDNNNNDKRIVMIGSSLRGESSYAHHSNADLGLASIERYTFAVDQFFAKRNNEDWKMTTRLYDALVAPYTYDSQRAHIGIRPTWMRDDTRSVVSDFFDHRKAVHGRNGDHAPQPWYPKSLWKASNCATWDDEAPLPPPRIQSPPQPTQRRLAWEDMQHPESLTAFLPWEDAVGPFSLIVLVLVMSLVSVVSKQRTASPSSRTTPKQKAN